MPDSVRPLPSEIYDRDYFLSDICEGWDQFREDRGLSFNKSKQVSTIGPRPGLRVLDAGCGRGEALLACARAGAEVAGVDYSKDAVELTRQTLADFPESDVRLGDLTALPWPDDSFDRILFSDVIEHLTPEQAAATLSELHRVLRPGGFLLLHTAPNRLFMKVGWPVARPLLLALGHRDRVDEMDRWWKVAESYHINEQTIYSIRRQLRAAGFARSRVWIDRDVLRSGQYRYTAGMNGPVMKLAVRAASLRPVRLFYGNDLYALAHSSPG